MNLRLSIRSSRWLLFALLFLTVPFPTFVLEGAFVPPARFALLTAVGGVLAGVEHVSRSAELVLVLFALHAVVTTAIVAVAAWCLGLATEPLSNRRRAQVVLGAFVIGLAIALAFDLYHTPFGHAPRGNLLAVLS